MLKRLISREVAEPAFGEQRDTAPPPRLQLRGGAGANPPKPRVGGGRHQRARARAERGVQGAAHRDRAPRGGLPGASRARGEPFGSEQPRSRRARPGSSGGAGRRSRSRGR